MPKNKVSDLITDQEMAFARLILAGGMTDRDAAEAVGLNPDSAAYTKTKPHVRAFMLEHRAAKQQQLAQQDADELQRRNLDRERVLARLWQIADLSSEMTRGSMTSQVKALSMIIAIQNLIPSDRKSAPAPIHRGSTAPNVVTPSVAEGPVVSREPQPNSGKSSEAPRSYAPLFGSIPDLGVALPIKNPFVHPR